MVYVCIEVILTILSGVSCPRMTTAAKDLEKYHDSGYPSTINRLTLKQLARGWWVTVGRSPSHTLPFSKYGLAKVMWHQEMSGV